MSNLGTQLGLKHRILVSTNRCDTLETMHELTLIYMARVMALEVFWAVKFHWKEWFHPSETEKLAWCHMCNMFHIGRGGVNFDQTGMCHWRLKFITLFWSGKTQKGYPALELPLFVNLLDCVVLYCIVLYCIVLYCIVLYCIREEDHVYTLHI